jgi:hypothetical protein
MNLKLYCKMKVKKSRGNEIEGHLEVIVIDRVEEFEGEVDKWKEVLIHGDPKGLKSLAKLLIKIANLNQNKDTDMPIGAREHYHLRPNLELSKSSVEAIVGRLDTKGTSEFYESYVAKD